MDFKTFLEFSKLYGLPYALLIAVGIAYWLEIRDRNKNTVSKEVYNKQEDRCNKVADDTAEITKSLAALTEMVKVILFGGGKRD